MSRIPRLKVKVHLCHDSRAKDANIRQAILDRFGGKAVAIGSKRQPGRSASRSTSKQKRRNTK